jgi:hypothetical protein
MGRTCISYVERNMYRIMVGKPFGKWSWKNEKEMGK